MDNFKFYVSTNLKYGVGQSEKLSDYITELGYKNMAVIVDTGVQNNNQVTKAIGALKSSNLNYTIYINDAVEPTYMYLEEFRKRLSGKGHDCIVGIGGGSVLDLAKGIATLLTNSGPALSYKGFPRLENKPLPVIAIPTTAGTGSEVTYNAVFTDSDTKKKLGINSVMNFPVLAIIDPMLTVNCPKTVTVSSGCDALVHTLESYVHKNHTIISRMYSKEAFRLLYNALTKVLDDPSNVNIRSDLAMGAYFAGTALINAGSGPSGAFSYPLGAVYKVPHGYAGAVFLPSIIRINVEKGYADYDKLYELIDGADISLPSKQKNQRFADNIQKLMDKLEVPKSLSFYKLGQKDIEFMIGQYDILKAAIDQNPIEVTKNDVIMMMKQLA